MFYLLGKFRIDNKSEDDSYPREKNICCSRNIAGFVIRVMLVSWNNFGCATSSPLFLIV